MTTKKGKSSKTRSFPLDFRSSSDDAWYAVRLIFENDILTVKYSNLSDKWDERFKTGEFKDLKTLEDFKERFRPTSIQLQDKDCVKMNKGRIVCVSYVFGDNDLRFYDAVIDSVSFSTHELIKGKEEVCKCNFIVLWQHGPNAGTKTSTTIEHICLLQSEDAKNSILDSFLEVSRRKLELNSQSACFISEGENSKEMKSRNQLGRSDFNGKSPDGQGSIGQDTDLGGGYFASKYLEVTGNCYFILIGNLEKDLSPSIISDFIYQQTSILSQSYVSPSLLSESHTMGAIFVESQEKLAKLVSFLDSPVHLIMSSRGRPWVITEQKWRSGTFGAYFGGLMLKFEVLEA
ncbi:SAWADEE protein isoform X2 [Tasmannia lanceolata]|uniref:SAWADEE protein isoform X2 n=1 Tax=Tasmannia lanceolata TaxID=3420 RepID=UPI0040632BC2